METIQINESAIRAAVRRALLGEAVENEDMFDPVRNRGEQRDFVTQDQFVQLMSSVGKDKFVVFGYLNGVEFNKDYMVKKKMPGDKVPKGYPDYEKITKELGRDDKDIQGIVKCSILKIHWQDSKSYGEDYGKYKATVNQIRADLNSKHGFNMPMISTADTRMTGDPYTGDNTEIPANSNNGNSFYSMQNVANPASRSTAYYVIDSAGHIVGKEISADAIKSMLKKRSIDGVAALRKLTNDENIINGYIAAVKDLRHSPRRFKDSGFMFLVGTTNKDGVKHKYIYINHNLTNNVKGITVNPAEFHNLIMQRYSKACTILDNPDDNGVRNLDRATAQKQFNDIYNTIPRPGGEQKAKEMGALQEEIRRFAREEVRKLLK